jgi:hypothetical protein
MVAGASKDWRARRSCSASSATGLPVCGILCRTVPAAPIMARHFSRLTSISA